MSSIRAKLSAIEAALDRAAASCSVCEANTGGAIRLLPIVFAPDGSQLTYEAAACPACGRGPVKLGAIVLDGDRAIL